MSLFQRVLGCSCGVVLARASIRVHAKVMHSMCGVWRAGVLTGDTAKVAQVPTSPFADCPPFMFMIL